MPFNLMTTKQTDTYQQDGQVWINLPLPPGLREGAYVLDVARKREDGTASVSFVRFGNQLIRVPLMNMTPNPQVEAIVQNRDLACLLGGLDLAGKLVAARGWTQWPDTLLLVHVEDMPGLIVGIVALV